MGMIIEIIATAIGFGITWFCIFRLFLAWIEMEVEDGNVD